MALQFASGASLSTSDSSRSLYHLSVLKQCSMLLTFTYFIPWSYTYLSMCVKLYFTELNIFNHPVLLDFYKIQYWTFHSQYSSFMSVACPYRPMASKNFKGHSFCQICSNIVAEPCNFYGGRLAFNLNQLKFMYCDDFWFHLI